MDLRRNQFWFLRVICLVYLPNIFLDRLPPSPKFAHSFELRLLSPKSRFDVQNFWRFDLHIFFCKFDHRTFCRFNPQNFCRFYLQNLQCFDPWEFLHFWPSDFLQIWLSGFLQICTIPNFAKWCIFLQTFTTTSFSAKTQVFAYMCRPLKLLQ